MAGKVSHSWSIKRLLKLRSTALPILNAGTKTTRDVWEAVREKRNKVNWHKIIWFPSHIPKFSMIAWMDILDRFPTRERLSRMCIVNDCRCVLYNETNETRDHLFSECSFAKSLWSSILNLSQLHVPHMTWEEKICWASKEWKGKSLLTTILKLAWTSFIYLIWEERNRRIYHRGSREVDQVLSSIKELTLLRSFVSGTGSTSASFSEYVRPDKVRCRIGKI
ncbi:uncharacterized protein LOC120160623 [Hibiscus syriacus]|uniref:uncharacterized protein LOC120160623 n=1 Tax=Hibiscus syriacus TaxID=106335 RepID=UPI0019226D8A|nr:uncharacterized protein LOC120160623 [Hibiscus syriacus]